MSKPTICDTEMVSILGLPIISVEVSVSSYRLVFRLFQPKKFLAFEDGRVTTKIVKVEHYNSKM